MRLRSCLIHCTCSCAGAFACARVSMITANPYLWKVIHLMSSFSTMPLVMSSSPKRCTSMPRFSFCWKSMPDCLSSSMLSCAYTSSARLKPRKLNCHTHSSPLQRGRLPTASVSVRPSWMSFSMSTFILRAV